MRRLPRCGRWKRRALATTTLALSPTTPTIVTRPRKRARKWARRARAPRRAPFWVAIPGVGPVVAAGWLVATLTGAGVGAVAGGAAGGLVGSLTHAGVPEQDAHVYAEGVRRGGSLVTVRADEARVAEAERILAGRAYVDPALRRTEYAQTGWDRFDESRGPYVPAGGTAPGAPSTTPRSSI